MKHFDVIICGGGAAGFFAAINIAENNPKISVAILERGKNVLEKVRISGGGRCNVMHSCYEPRELTKYYPRGEKELRGPFHTFGSSENYEWFGKHGVDLKTEADGRMFPTSDSSQTIIDCFINLTKKLNILVLTGQSIQSIYRSDDHWKIDTQNENFACRKLIMATGSNPKIWNMLQQMGHSIIEPVPSLFTFNIKDPRIKDLAGLSAPATVKVHNTKLEASGPTLITHWGMSGPGILKLSAWGARILADLNYRFKIAVNWMDDVSMDDAIDMLSQIKNNNPKKLVTGKSSIALPARLWERLVQASGIGQDEKWADLSKAKIFNLAAQLTNCEFNVDGKSTFKEEFVTAGGIDLKEINFKTMESKILPEMYFAGEIINVDAITGGFNFQNAWTTAFLAATEITGNR